MGLYSAIAYAQEAVNPPLATTAVPPSQVDALTAGSVNCFDYYHFDSVQVDVSPNLKTPANGVSLNFSGTIKNTNEYPIVDGQVYAKIFYKSEKDDSLAHQNSYPLVAQFIVSDGVNLGAKEIKPISFDWKVPRYAQSGDYEIAMYFTSAHRYNLLGLSFTDDVTGNKTEFSVLGNSPQIATFDKNTVQFNDEPFRFAAFPLHFSKDENVKASATIINPTNKPTTVTLTWKAYAWDAMLPEHLKDMKMDVVMLNPNEKKVVSYAVPFIESSVSYVVAEARVGDATSLLDMRFVRDGIEETRINFPGVQRYPLIKGQENTLFSCMHSTNMSVVKDNILTLTLNDEKGGVIHAYSYSGDITANMMGMKDTFTPKKSLSTFSLTAKLEHGGKVVETETLHYDCKQIDPTQCNTETPAPYPTSLIIVIMLFVVAVGIYLKKKNITTV